MYNPNITKSYHNFNPHSCDEEMLKLKELLSEIVETLTERSDGVDLTIIRTDEFPQHKGRNIIQAVKISSYDCAA